MTKFPREKSRLEEIAVIARSALVDDTFTYSLASLEEKILAVPMEIDKGHDKRDFKRSVLKIQKEGGLTARERNKAECILKDWQDETNRNNARGNRCRANRRKQAKLADQSKEVASFGEGEWAPDAEEDEDPYSDAEEEDERESDEQLREQQKLAPPAMERAVWQPQADQDLHMVRRHPPPREERHDSDPSSSCCESGREDGNQGVDRRYLRQPQPLFQAGALRQPRAPLHETAS